MNTSQHQDLARRLAWQAAIRGHLSPDKASRFQMVLLADMEHWDKESGLFEKQDRVTKALHLIEDQLENPDNHDELATLDQDARKLRFMAFILHAKITYQLLLYLASPYPLNLDPSTLTSS